MIYFEDIQLNQVARSATHTIETEEIIAFASEWDPQPFHTSEEDAKHWPLGFSASSLHTLVISNKLMNAMKGEQPAAIAGLGMDELRMPCPVRPGDTLVVHAYVGAKRESNSKPHLGIITSHVEVYNQHQQAVLTYKNSSMVLKRPAESEEQT